MSPLNDPADFPAAFCAAWAARDAAALAELFADDADFVNVVGLWWEDRAAIERAHRYGFERIFPGSRLLVGRVKVRPLGTEAAVVQARLRLTGQSAPSGGTAGPRTTILTAVLHRGDAGWLAVAAQNTDVVPGAETHLADDESFRPTDYRG